MRWKDVIGQHGVKEVLQRCISGGRIPQALLICGQEGAGTVALSLAFARSLVCEAPIDGSVPCERCHSCMQSSALQHPNIRIISSLPTGSGSTDDELKPEVIDEIKVGVQAMAKNPYQPLQLAGATQIKIGQVRELKRTLALSGAQEGRRVVLILRADEMTTEAANAFLKTLEEPHADTTLLLTCANTERLMQTIVSRCQTLVCPPLGEDDIADELVRQGVATETEARLLAPFAQGSYIQALAFLDEDMKSAREDALTILRASLKGKDFRIGLVDAIADLVEGKDKNKIVNMISLTSMWLRDAQILAHGAVDVQLANGDQRDALIKFAEAFGIANMDRALFVLEQCAKEIYRNVHPTLSVLTAMLNIRSIFLQARMQNSSTQPIRGVS